MRVSVSPEMIIVTGESVHRRELMQTTPTSVHSREIGRPFFQVALVAAAEQHALLFGDSASVTSDDVDSAAKRVRGELRGVSLAIVESARSRWWGRVVRGGGAEALV